MKPLVASTGEEYEGEKERGQSCPRGGTLRVHEEETHIYNPSTKKYSI
jgi:hypothetical protein